MDTSMSNREKLLHMYEYAIAQGKCKNRKSFAELIGINEKNLSNALSTNEKVADRFCTNGLLNKANAALNYAFAQQWLQDGTGEMYANNNVQAPAPTQAHTRVQALGTKPSFDDDDIEYLRHRIKELEYVIGLQRHRIEQLEGAAKRGNVSAARAN